MKTRAMRLGAYLFFTAILSPVLAPDAARAASATWLASPTSDLWEAGAGDENWSTGVGTWPGGTSTSSGDSATFDVNSSITNISITSSWNIKNITFDTADCAAYTFNITGGTPRFTSGGTIKLTSTVTQPQAFLGSQIRLHPTGGTTLLNDSATPTATLSFAGGFKANNSTGSETQSPINLQGANTGSNVISGPIVDYHTPNDSGYAPVSINKSGAGTWYLTANNTYSGPTTVSGGLLALTGAGSVAQSSSITITGGTLQWENPFSTTNIEVDDSGALIIGSSAEIENLTLTNASLTLPAAELPPTVADALTVSGVTTVSVSSVPIITNYNTAQFAVLGYTNQTGLDDTSFALGNLPSTYEGYLSNNIANATIDVVITNGPALPKLLTWDGAASGDWNTTDANWKTNASFPAVAYSPGDIVNFDDSLSGTTNVNLPGDVMPSGIAANNSASNYVFTGSGGIRGTTGLTKDGSGDLRLANTGPNDFSGDIVLNAGSLTFDQTDDATVANTISGSAGTLVKANTNTLTLAGINSYGGDTVISNGTILVTSFSSLGETPGGSVTINNGAALDLGGMTSPDGIGFDAKQFTIAGSGPDGSGAIVNSGSARQLNAIENVALESDATFGGAMRWDMRGGSPGPNLDLGGHTLTKKGANQISLVGVAVTAGDVIIDDGILSFEASSSFTGSGNITVNSGGALGQYRPASGSMTRPITLNGGSILNLATSGTVGTNDAPITLTANSTLSASSAASYTLVLNGIIAEQGGSFGLTQTGAGMFTLTAADTYSGDTVISNGTLALADSGSISSSAHIVVASGATLDASARTDGALVLANQTLSGNGTIAGKLQVASDSTVAPGSSSSIGMLTDSGNVELQRGANLTVKIQDAAAAAGVGYDTLQASGNIALATGPGDPITIRLVSLDGTGTAGAVTNFDNTTNYTWTIVAGVPTNFDASAFTVDTSAFANSLGSGKFFVTTDGGGIQVVLKGGASLTPPPRAQNYTVVSGHPMLSGHGIPGYTFGVESASDVSGPWAQVSGTGTVTVQPDGSWIFADSNVTEPGTTIFYRLYYPSTGAAPQ